MAEEISKEVFGHLVELAALELDETESEYLRKELNNQLKILEELVLIPIPDDIEPAAHGVPYQEDKSSPLREDIHKMFPNHADILENAPEIDDNYFKVPNIPHEDLG